MKRKPLKYYQAKKFFDFNTEDYSKLTPSQLKKQADYWLRQYLLRTTESRNGRYLCPIKNQWLLPEYMEVSHYIDRICLQLRYDLRNSHLLSKQSNSFDAQVQKEGYKSLHHYDFEQYLNKKFGEKILQELLQEQNKIVIFTREDYIEKIKFFRDVER